MIKGSKRIIWTDESVSEFFNSGIKVEVSEEVKRKLDAAISRVGDYYIDHSMTCKKDKASARRVLVVCKKDGYKSYKCLADILKSKYECYGCVVENLKSKLASKNHNLIDYLPESNKSIIECKFCWTVSSQLKSTILGKNKIDCESCRINLYKHFCELKNSEYLSHRRVKNGILVSVKCNVCGSTDELYSSSILSKRNNRFKCKRCLDAKYEEYLSNSNFSFSQYIDEHYCEVSCNTHKNILRIARTTIRRGIKAFTCPLCVEEKIKNRLSAKNCNYITNTTSKTTYLGIDGTKFTRSNGVIYSGRFPVSLGHRRNQPYKLYIIGVEYLGSRFIKLGIATDPEIRLKSLGLFVDSSMVVLKDFDSGSKAQMIEYSLFKHFSKFRVCHTIPESFCSGIKRNKTDGATEWFDASVLSNGFYEVLNDLCCDT